MYEWGFGVLGFWGSCLHSTPPGRRPQAVNAAEGEGGGIKAEADRFGRNCKTLNNERRTLNVECREIGVQSWLFDVACHSRPSGGSSLRGEDVVQGGVKFLHGEGLLQHGIHGELTRGAFGHGKGRAGDEQDALGG